LKFDETIASFLEKQLDEYVHNANEDKERLPQSPYRRLELIPEAARDIIKVNSMEMFFLSDKSLLFLGKTFAQTSTNE